MTHPTSKRSKLAGAFLGALLVSPTLAAAQGAAQGAAQAPAMPAAPRTTLTLSVAGGRILRTSFDEGEHAAVAGVGARRMLWRSLMVEGAAQLQARLTTGEYTVLQCHAPSPAGECRVRGYGSQVAGADVFGSALARVGVDHPVGRGARVRLAGGAGHMTRIGEPFATVAGGLSVGGPRLRLALELDRWIARIPATERTLNVAAPQDATERTFRERSTSTYVRLGAELPIGGRAR